MTDSGTDIGAPKHARREHDPFCRCNDPRWRSPVWCTCDEIVKIRADERARAEQSRYVWVPSQREILADLRAQVEALRGKWQRSVDRDPDGKLSGYDRAHVAALDDVLALIDGSSDD